MLSVISAQRRVSQCQFLTELPGLPFGLSGKADALFNETCTVTAPVAGRRCSTRGTSISGLEIDAKRAALIEQYQCYLLEDDFDLAEHGGSRVSR